MTLVSQETIIRRMPTKRRSVIPAPITPVSDLESHVGYWLRFVSNHVSGRFQKRMESQGLTVSEWVALRRLLSTGPSNTGALVEALGMTKGAVTKVIDRLTDKGLVERASDPSDGRVQRVALTRAGRALVPRLARLADENDEHFFGHLPSSQRLELVAMLRELVRRHQLTRIPTE